jgi:hypothetical protein
MQIPSSTFAVVAFVVLFVPGFVFAVVRIWMRGFRADDKGIDTRIAQALVVSVILDAVYLIVVFPWLPSLVDVSDKAIKVLRPIGLGFTILIAAVIVPAIIAALIYRPWKASVVATLEVNPLRPIVRFAREVAARLPVRFERQWSYNSVPTAWDWGAARPKNRYVRILYPDGRWFGGYYDGDSYVSTYPEPRDIYISQPWKISETGAFQERNTESVGMWLAIPEGAIVEWLWGGERQIKSDQGGEVTK